MAGPIGHCGPAGPAMRSPATALKRQKTQSIKWMNWVSVGAPEGIRTPNLLIRSQMLYPLSYGRNPRHRDFSRCCATRKYITLPAKKPASYLLMRLFAGFFLANGRAARGIQRCAAAAVDYPR